MKGDYFFPLYYQKLLTSTTGWKDDEFGAYLKLLIYQFDNGSIPNNLELICRIAPSAKRSWDLLLSKKFVLNEEGNLINIVMDGIRNKRINKSEVNKENGQLGGRPKKQTVTNNETESKPNGSQNHNRNESNNNMVTVLLDSGLQKGGSGENIQPVGMERTVEIANEVWKDKAWVQALCSGCSISEADMKKWMNQFNASISTDNFTDFGAGRYKKIFRGWLNKEKSKGTTVSNGSNSGPSDYRLPTLKNQSDD